jgi:hypothetical protein
MVPAIGEASERLPCIGRRSGFLGLRGRFRERLLPGLVPLLVVVARIRFRGLLPGRRGGRGSGGGLVLLRLRAASA